MNAESIDLWLKLVTLVLGVFGALKAFHDWRSARDQKAQELRWNQARLAKEVLDEQSRSQARDAMQMLDWSGRRYKAGNVEVIVTWQEVTEALRTQSKRDLEGFTAKEAYLRDCFDALFESYSRLEHFIVTGLLRFEDVEVPTRYYVERMVGLGPKAFEQFMSAYGYEDALKYCRRFAAWPKEAQVTRRPSPAPDPDRR